jgi:septal ring-binding cell division protein DamX
MFEQINKFADAATTTVTDAFSAAVTDNTERFATTSDQVLDAVLDTNRRIVDVAVTTADRIVEQINVELPFGDRLPTPAAAGERYLEFVEHAVSFNRDLNQRVVEMIKADNAQAAAATKTTVAKKRPAKKTAARKTAAKKTAASK